MKENNDIESLLDNEKGQLDVFEPRKNHKALFLEKLEKQNTTVVQLKPKKREWIKYISIAASVVFISAFSVLMFQFNKKQTGELATVSVKMEDTQNFFTLAIQEQLEEINKNASDENSQLIQDAMKQLEKLESNYETLKIDLIESNNDRRVISAMINNFQKRASLLEDVLEKMVAIKILKTTKNENNIL